ncbi:MAG: DUF2079 domain-containing protein, partial [Eubacteriales bacterium]|nr:DUF2079 domain-containing protein [Eubacteriales bacterium]
MKRAALIKIREKTINYLAQLLGAFLLLRSVTVFFKAQFEPFLAPISLFSFGLDFLLVNLLAFTLIPILKRCFENAAWLWSCLSIFFASNLLSYVLQAKLDSRQDFLLQLFIFTLLFAYALRQNFRALGAKPKTAPLKAPGSANSNSLVWLLALLITAVLFHLIVNTLYFKYRMNSLLSPAFDYGIFVQAMEGIIRTARPLTSIERGYELSHSAVHFSPILYLLAPVYAIFRTASCLNYLQTIIVLLALIPAYFFMKNSGFKLSLNLVILGLLAFSPFQILSTHYDFHENCFLPLTIFTYLWLKSTKVNPAWDFLAALAILMVKEDAFIYLFSLSLFFLIRAVKNMDFKAVKHEFLLLSFSLFYFILAALYIRSFGLGIMTNRFNNLCRYPQVGILDVLLSFWFRPSLVLTQILHYGKLRYLCMSFICSGFALIWSKRYELWVLAIPLVFVNLLSSWKYQTDIFFQYHQG